MAPKKNFLYLGGGEKVNPITPDLEFDEADVWNLSGVVSNEPKRLLFGSRAPKKIVKRNDHAINRGRAVTGASLPVNVPDWSKILCGEYKNRRMENDDDDNGDDEDEEDRIPPHEYLARTRIASFSVHEGIGRTLKGRDLRRVRNDIWKQTGFED